MLAEKTLTHTSENIEEIFFATFRGQLQSVTVLLGSTKNRPFKTYLARSGELSLRGHDLMIMALIKNRVKSSS